MFVHLLNFILLLTNSVPQKKLRNLSIANNHQQVWYSLLVYVRVVCNLYAEHYNSQLTFFYLQHILPLYRTCYLLQNILFLTEHYFSYRMFSFQLSNISSTKNYISYRTFYFSTDHLLNFIFYIQFLQEHYISSRTFYLLPKFLSLYRTFYLLKCYLLKNIYLWDHIVSPI